MSDSCDFDIETLLNECRPGSILVIGDGPGDAVERYAGHRRLLERDCRVDVLGVPPDIEGLGRRYDIGIVLGALERMGKAEGLRMLSRLRDLYTGRFCVAVEIVESGQAADQWSRNELLGVGMSLVNRYGEPGEERRLHLYKYDIATYKPTPRWLNPDDWANPELWNKYRW